MSTLDDAVGRYRDAVTAMGLAWRDGVAPTEDEVAFARRLFDVDTIPDDVVGLYELIEVEALVLPEVGYLLGWPASSQALVELGASIGVPFPWRWQMPVFNFERIFYTVVLAGPHAGEVWRYDVDVDAEEGAVRAAPDLATLFDQWADGIAAGMLHNEEGFVMCNEEHLNPPIEPSAARFRESNPPLDMRAFPLPVFDEPDLAAWQQECGVDPDAFIDTIATWEALDREVTAVRREFRD